MQVLRAIQNHIIFQFIDEVDGKGQFVESTKWGFVIPGEFDNSAKLPRWGVVTHVGPDCEIVKVGQQVLINALKWTINFKVNEDRHWRTDEGQIVAIRDNETSDMTILHDIVIFKRHEERVNQSKAGLEVVGEAVVETAKGSVRQVGPDCFPELKDSVIYFNEENFFNKFEHNGEKLWYIEEPDVLVYRPA